MPIKYDSLDAGNEIVLTFNDGPHSIITPKILDILKHENVKAIFFVIGVNAATPNNYEIVQRAYEEGHTIGNHSYFHRNLKSISDYEVKFEILKAEEILKEFLSAPKLFRPPYGITDSRIEKIAQRLGYVNVMYDVEAFDKEDNSEEWIENTVSQLHSRQYSIIQMHDSHELTLQKLPGLIKAIRNENSQNKFIIDLHKQFVE